MLKPLINYFVENIPALSKLRKYSLMKDFADTAASKILQLEKTNAELKASIKVYQKQVQLLKEASSTPQVDQENTQPNTVKETHSNRKRKN